MQELINRIANIVEKAGMSQFRAGFSIGNNIHVRISTLSDYKNEEIVRTNADVLIVNHIFGRPIKEARIVKDPNIKLVDRIMEEFQKRVQYLVDAVSGKIPLRKSGSIDEEMLKDAKLHEIRKTDYGDKDIQRELHRFFSPHQVPAGLTDEQVQILMALRHVREAQQERHADGNTPGLAYGLNIMDPEDGSAEFFVMDPPTLMPELVNNPDNHENRADIFDKAILQWLYDIAQETIPLSRLKIENKELLQ
jgi:hypothetical protein